MLLVLLIAITHTSMAQQKPTAHFTEEDGLAGNVVHDIKADRFGNLWIATEKGLSCYNGNSFRNFYKTDGLPSNAVWAVEFDNQNNLFVGCYRSGLAAIRNDSVVKILHTNGPYPNSFRSLHYSSCFKTLLVGTDYGLFNLQDTTLIPVEFPKDSEKKAATTSIAEGGGHVFFTNLGWKLNGLYKLMVEGKNNRKFYAKRISANGHFASAVMNDSLYYNGGNLIYSCPLTNVNLTRVYAPVDSQFLIWTMMPYRNKELWLGGWGEGRFRGSFGKLVFGDSYSEKPISINAQSVWKIYEEPKSKTVWIASDNGLYCAYQSPFTEYSCSKNGNILDMAIVGDSTMVLTEKGVFLFKEGQLVKVIDGTVMLNRVLRTYNKILDKTDERFGNLFSSHRTIELSNFLENDGQLYVQTTKGIISIPDLKQYIAIGLGAVKLIKGHAAYSGVLYQPLCYHPSLSLSRVLDYDTLRAPNGLLNEIFKIVESKGVFYCASRFNGVYAIRHERIYSLNDSNSSLDNNLTDIAKDDGGNIWCCSANGNLLELGLSDSLFVRKILTPQNAGITGTYCNWLIFTGKELLLSTNLGLNIFRLDSLKGKQPQVDHFYNSYNGYDAISAVGPIRDRFGNVYVHTTDRIIKISPDRELKQQLNILVQGVFINGKAAQLAEIEDQSLPFSTHSIELEFCVIKYPSAKNMSYSYRVNDGGWVVGSKVNMESPRSGSYTVTLQAFDKENRTVYLKTISFKVRLPFWLELWFLVPLALLIILFIFLIVKIRIIRLNQQHEERSALITSNSELQLRSLQLQMNPHFIFNSLQSIQGYVLDRNVEEGLTFIGNLSSVIRANLANAAEEYIPLSAEIEFLKKYVEIEKIRFQNTFQVTFSNKLDDWNVMLPPMLIQPLVENAIKHGVRNHAGRGLIKVEISKNDNQLVIAVEDNGVGREYTKNLKKSDGNGKGLDIIVQRLNLLNARTRTNAHKLEFVDLSHNGLPAGTRAIIQLIYQLQEG